MSTCSKLYSILKSPDTIKIPKIDFQDDKNDMVPAKRSHTDEKLWQCWECGKTYEAGSRLSDHLKICKKEDDVCEQLAGCPFCSHNINQPNDAPFHIHSFNLHLHNFHPDVKSFVCSYCMDVIRSNKIEDLVSHVILIHKIPWRPSPASLAHMRKNQLPHRVVTCLGCGWCTFVLRANNAAQPPTSLETHLSRCSANGGQVHLTRLSEEACLSVLEKYKALQEAERISATFAQSFPNVRGFSDNSGVTSSPLRFHRYTSGNTPRETDVASNTLESNTYCQTTDCTDVKSSTKQKSKLETILEQPNFKEETFFDIPLTIPPPPPRSGQKKSTPGRLFVCPLCGDNALSSLRERDEHIQSSHNGELVFPCQICGVAYPLYIALRRHAALQHDSDFDTVRYGPSDLLDCEPIECPECHLVAFQDPVVLQLHISRVHKKLQQNVTITPCSDSQPKTTDPEVALKTKINKTKANSSQKKNSNTTRRPRVQPKNSKAKLKLSILGESEIHNDSATRPSDVQATSEFERVLSAISGAPAAACCRQCHVEVDNLKELQLHLELEHSNPETEIEQLGCQACGRVFFGSGGRIDLIGHLRALHQDDFLQNVLRCPRAEKLSQDTSIINDANPVSHEETKSCKAYFSSPRLRQLHASANNSLNHEFSCPILFNDKEYSSDDIKKLILETEVLADRSGVMILAFCCPNCSRIFVGDDVHSRFETHRNSCETEVDNADEPMNQLESELSVSSVDSPEVSEVVVQCATVNESPLEFHDSIKMSTECPCEN
ncbi:unnamed protein product [Trichobilharzia szidati]|nr:unnamed protein product [Trichobilharzia szidati]